VQNADAGGIRDKNQINFTIEMAPTDGTRAAN
jgi:hypothetical protein